MNGRLSPQLHSYDFTLSMQQKHLRTSGKWKNMVFFQLHWPPLACSLSIHRYPQLNSWAQYTSDLSHHPSFQLHHVLRLGPPSLWAGIPHSFHVSGWVLGKNSFFKAQFQFLCLFLHEVLPEWLKVISAFLFMFLNYLTWLHYKWQRLLQTSLVFLGVGKNIL